MEGFTWAKNYHVCHFKSNRVMMKMATQKQAPDNRFKPEQIRVASVFDRSGSVL
jgi:hypothetical protein